MLEYVVNGKFFRSDSAVNPTFGAWWMSLDEIVEKHIDISRSDLVSLIEEFDTSVIMERDATLDEFFIDIPSAPNATAGSS